MVAEGKRVILVLPLFHCSHCLSSGLDGKFQLNKEKLRKARAFIVCSLTEARVYSRKLRQPVLLLIFDTMTGEKHFPEAILQV